MLPTSINSKQPLEQTTTAEQKCKDKTKATRSNHKNKVCISRARNNHHPTQQTKMMVEQHQDRRHVSFSSNVINVIIPNITDSYTQRQKRTLWYQNDEYRLMTNIIPRQSTIDPPTTNDCYYDHCYSDSEEEDNPVDDDQLDNLGMITKLQTRQRRDRVRRSRVVVFREQELQWSEEGLIFDEDLLADIYFETTSHCQWLATQRGQTLSNHIKKLINEDTKLRIARKRIRLLSPSSSTSKSLSLSSLSSLRSTSSTASLSSSSSSLNSSLLSLNSLLHSLPSLSEESSPATKMMISPSSPKCKRSCLPTRNTHSRGGARMVTVAALHHQSTQQVAMRC